MAQFDTKRYEENQQRKIHLRNFAHLLPSAQDTLLEIIVNNAKRTDLFHTCVTCKHFETIESITEGEIIERCKLVGKRPPAKVIADGCERYMQGFLDDDIPF